jgi:hypothetical protein
MKAYLKLIAILLLPLVFVIWYANVPVQIPPPGWKLSKIQEAKQTIESTDTIETMDAIETIEPRMLFPGTTAHHILFFGDSMLEGLLRRMNSYAYTNGHSITNIVWYSSTTKMWAQTDTLRYFINKIKPTFAMISIGANEQFVKDADSMEPYIRQIIKDLGNIPFVWIGVPAWKEDSGINDLTQRVVGKNRYFDSRGLTLERGRDHMHPTFSAASDWMDSVAVWMASPETAHPIRMDRPTDGEKHTYKTYALQPLRK